MSSEKNWNVWIEGSPKKMGYFKGRDRLEKSLGVSSGSGSGFDCWDISYHGLKDEQTARNLAMKAARFGFVKEARYYLDRGDDIYTKRNGRRIKAKR